MMFKACARCRGDLYREENLGQADLVCLQCGYRVSLAPIRKMAAGRLVSTRVQNTHISARAAA
jgi:DNA-directed RNA polymerase subunit RPC12/RpoP